MRKRILFITILAILLCFLCACNKSTKKTEPTKEPSAPTATKAEVPTKAPTATKTPVPTKAPAPTAAIIGNKYEIPYVLDGLVALYEGYYNTEDGQNKESTVWKDLSGNGNDLEVELSEGCVWEDDGLFIDSQKILFPEEILDTINGDAFTVELVLKDFELKGRDFATFINNDGNDNYSLFIRVSNDNLEIKLSPGQTNPRPMAPDASNMIENATITSTFDLDEGTSGMYIDGELMSETTPVMNVNADGTMFLGHSDPSRNYSATVISIRFYNRALTEAEITQNSNAKGMVKAVTQG